jgi:hypothetical protein
MMHFNADKIKEECLEFEKNAEVICPAEKSPH